MGDAHRISALEICSQCYCPNKNESYHQHIKSMIEKQQAMMEDSIAEREIMLKGILTIIKSLNEPNGINSIDTKSIERDINEFLIKKCHK